MPDDRGQVECVDCQQEVDVRDEVVFCDWCEEPVCRDCLPKHNCMGQERDREHVY